MPQLSLSPETKEKIAGLLREGKTYREIELLVGVSQGAICNVKNKLGVQVKKYIEPQPQTQVAPEKELHTAIRSAIKREPKSVEELADLLDCGPGKIKAALADMESLGAMLLKTVDGKYDLGSSIHLEPGKHEVAGSANDEWTHRFGVTKDNHLCNKHSRLDVLNEAYDHFEAEGITRVFNCGNWIDGEAKFNKTELVTRPGMDAQCDYLIDNW